MFHNTSKYFKYITLILRGQPSEANYNLKGKYFQQSTTLLNAIDCILSKLFLYADIQTNFGDEQDCMNIYQLHISLEKSSKGYIKHHFKNLPLTFENLFFHKLYVMIALC